MKTSQTHTRSVIRYLAILTGVFLLSLISTGEDTADQRSLHVPESVNYIDTEKGLNGEETPCEPGKNRAAYTVVLKETPKQEQTTSASLSQSVVKQGNNPPETGFNLLSADNSIFYKGLMLLPEKYRSGTLFRLRHHLLSHLISIHGDIAINAP